MPLINKTSKVTGFPAMQKQYLLFPFLEISYVHQIKPGVIADYAMYVLKRVEIPAFSENFLFYPNISYRSWLCQRSHRFLKNMNLRSSEE